MINWKDQIKIPATSSGYFKELETKLKTKTKIMKATFKLITLNNGKFETVFIPCEVLEIGANAGIRILVNGVEKWTEKSNVTIIK